LQTGDWVQGDPVKGFESNKVYIVEFWATWCGPCRVSIPHLNEVYKKYKDKNLVVIGQDCWEQDDSQVAPFVKRMGEKMTYRVALDDKQAEDKDSKDHKAAPQKGKMAESWMEPAGQHGIPAAFVINKEGKIAWIGHPMELKEEVIDQVLAGTFDLKKEAADFEVRQKNQAQLMSASRQFSAYMSVKQWDKAEASLAEIEKLLPEDDRAGLGPARVQIALGRGNEEAACQLAERLSKAQPENAQMQNQLAWELATHEGIKGSALDAAARIAERANSASGGKDPQVLHTCARVSFLRGEKDKAIELQAKAVELAEGQIKSMLQGALASYKEGKLPTAQ
jgi:thiol-disulfide isomerase/thioredoxin